MAVGIFFNSEPLTWVDTIDNQLLLSISNPTEILQTREEVETEMIAFVPGLGIASFKSV